MEKGHLYKTASRVAPSGGGGGVSSNMKAVDDSSNSANRQKTGKPSGHGKNSNGHAHDDTAQAALSGIRTLSDSNGNDQDHDSSINNDGEPGRTPKKRRKVNHACVYCRRSHMTCDLARPCTRCIKRNIGHLCHDEPRDSESRKSKSVVTTSAANDDDFSDARNSLDQSGSVTMRPPSFDAIGKETIKTPFDAGVLGQANPIQLVQPNQVSGIQPSIMGSGDVSVSQFGGFSDAWLTAQNHFHDINNHNYMIVPEVSGELQFLNDFLQSSMVDDAAYVSDDQNAQLLRSAPPEVATNFVTSSAAGTAEGSAVKTQNDGVSGNDPNESILQSGSNMPLLTSSATRSMLPPAGTSSSANTAGDAGTQPSRASTVAVASGDKARAYYLQAADPSGNDTPEQRMSDLLKAKYDAGMLKPFNYVNGYARLHKYLDSHRITPVSKQKIQRQLDKFRPKFREKMQALTDLELIYVEMWFERTLMEYDRVFASMAVPACCWRRTGEIFRGNKEMAELIHVPVDKLRDGKIALHEILTEESMVRYWEEFGTIAFDQQHDTLLTACSIKNPDDSSMYPIIQCCFSLKIRRDDHKIPSLIVGNFLPHDPTTQ